MLIQTWTLISLYRVKFFFNFVNTAFTLHTISRLLTLRCVLALCWSYLSLPDQPVGGTVWITFPFVRRVGLWLLLLSRYKADILNCVVYFKNRSFSVIKKVWFWQVFGWAFSNQWRYKPHMYTENIKYRLLWYRTSSGNKIFLKQWSKNIYNFTTSNTFDTVGL